MSRLAAACAVVLATLVQGCSSNMQWTKPGADPSAVARDSEQCREVALRRATIPVAPAGSSEAMSDRRTGGLSTSGGSNERFVAEQEEVRRCMLKRGYQLTPRS